MDRYLVGLELEPNVFLSVVGRDNSLWQDGAAIAAVTTDAEGRFALSGTGAERLVHLHTSGAGSAAALWRVVNRPGFNATPFNETARKQSPIIVSGSGHSVPVLHGSEPVFVVDLARSVTWKSCGMPAPVNGTAGRGGPL